MGKIRKFYFFSIKYLGTKNREVFLLNWFALTVAMVVIILSLSAVEFFKKYEENETFGSEAARIIKLDISLIPQSFQNQRTNSREMDWDDIAGSIKRIFATSEQLVNHVSPVFDLQAFLEGKIDGVKQQVLIALKNVDSVSKEILELTWKKSNGLKNWGEFDSAEGILLSESIIGLFDNPDSIKMLTINIQEGGLTYRETLPVLLVAESTPNEYVYMNSLKVDEVIRHLRGKKNRPTRIEVVLNRVQDIHPVSEKLKIMGFGVTNIYDDNREFIEMMVLRRQIAYILAFGISFLILLYVLRSLFHTIRAKKKEISYFLVSFVRPREISQMFMGNMIFCLFLSLIISLLFRWLFFFVFPEGVFFFFPSPWFPILFSLGGLTLIILLACFFSLLTIRKIDPIKVIQQID